MQEDDEGAQAPARRWRNCLDAYLEAIGRRPPGGTGETAFADTAFGTLQNEVINLPQLPALWVEVFISRAELMHARRADADDHRHAAYERHLDAVRRLRDADLPPG